MCALRVIGLLSALHQTRLNLQFLVASGMFLLLSLIPAVTANSLLATDRPGPGPFDYAVFPAGGIPFAPVRGLSLTHECLHLGACCCPHARHLLVVTGLSFA